MFVRSGTVGNYLLALRDLVQVWVHVVRGNVYRSLDMPLLILLGHVRVDEHRGAGIEIFLCIGQRNPRSVCSVGMTVTVCIRSGRGRRFHNHRRLCSVIASDHKNRRRDNQKNKNSKIHKLLFTKGFEHLVGMTLDIYLVEDLRDLAFFIDQERRPINAHVLFPVHGFLGPDSVGLNDFLLCVSDQVELEAILRTKLLMCFLTVDRNAQQLDLLLIEFVVRITERACFERSARCVVFRVKEKNDALTFVV